MQQKLSSRMVGIIRENRNRPEHDLSNAAPATMSANSLAPTATMPILLVIVTGFVLAGMDATAKYLAQAGLPVLLVLWGRYSFHTLTTFVAYAGAKRSLGFLRARRPGLQFVRACSLFIATACFYVALTHMQLADAASIQFLAPVLVTAFSGLFLGEKVGPRRWTAVAVAFAGVMVVTRPGSGLLGWWALLPLGTAILFAVYMILTRIVRTKDDPATTTFYTTAVGAVVLSGLVPLQWRPMDGTDWGLMVMMGAAGAAGHFLLVRAFHMAEASVLAPFTYSQVVAAVLWGFLVFGDVPSVWTLVGAAMIVGSGLYVWYRETTLRRRAG